MQAPQETVRSAGWWSDRSIRTKGLVVIALPIALLLAVLGSTSWFTHVNNRAQSFGTQARHALLVSDSLEGTVLRAYSSVQGYAITGSSSYLVSYEAASASAPKTLRQLESLHSLTPAASAAFGELVRATGRILTDLSGIRSTHGVSTSIPATQTLLHKAETDSTSFVNSVVLFENTENSVTSHLHGVIHSSNISVLVITIVAAGLAIGGGIALSWLFTSGVTTRLRRLERATETLERGGLPKDAPGGTDEIGRLSESLMSAATELRSRAGERDRARRQLEDILTASPVVSIRYDVDSRRFSYASPNVTRLLGITPEQALAEPAAVVERFHPEDAVHLRDELVSAMRTHRGRVSIVLRFRRDPMSEEWGQAEAIYTLEHGAEGKLVGVVAYFVDASERHIAQRAADERLSMLESIFHASPDTIVVRDALGHVVLASSNLTGVIGVDDEPEERDGAAVAQAHSGPTVSRVDRRLLDSLTTRCLAGEPTPNPVVTSTRLPGGEVSKFETRARPVVDPMGRVTGTVTVSRDITDHAQLEQSLRQASAEAGRASQAKSEFLSRMSHELRTPLNAILGFAQLLELDELRPDQESSVDQIERAGRHLLALINEVLDISRIEAGRLSLSAEAVEVGPVLDEVATLLTPTAEAADLELTVTSDDLRNRYVRADRQRLVQVLLNLGSNALKYNGPGGSVAFRTSCGPDDRMRFEVRDTGPGIPFEQQDQLFVPFSRLGAERSAVEGTGVGLALSKQLVELMGGTIGVESLPGHGSTFWVELLPAERADGDELSMARKRAEAARTATSRGAEDLRITHGSQSESEKGPPPDSSRADTSQYATEAAGASASRHLGPEVAPGEATAEETSRATSVGSPGTQASAGVQEAPTDSGSLLHSGRDPVEGSRDSMQEGRDSMHEEEAPRQQMVVLQVEDNPSNASLVEKVLARRPAVRLVSSTEAGLGLELARRYRPDLILLDLHLPDFPGEELLHRLRAVPELSRSKVIVVSADATPARIRRMLDMGVEGYLTKPVDVEALLRLVDLEIAASRGFPP